MHRSWMISRLEQLQVAHQEALAIKNQAERDMILIEALIDAEKRREHGGQAEDV